DQGGEARLFNGRGEVIVRVRVSEDIMPGSVSLDEGIWFELDDRGVDRAGSANILSSTKGTGPDNSCIMHAVAVEVARG
ncbi:MAG: molybdopterin dinucleotide binding domain-containing protein, partial [Spirochaetia bacterium]